MLVIIYIHVLELVKTSSFSKWCRCNYSGYRGNIKANFDNIKGYDFMEYELEIGDRFVQLCPPNLEYPMKVYIVDNINSLGVNTLRGDGGFGSTG